MADRAQYEDYYKRLAQWLKDTEGKCNDSTLVSTLEEKRAKLKKFQRFQQDISSRQPDFESLVVKAKQMDAKVAAKAEQLNECYQTLRRNIKKVIATWEDYVSKHQQYQTSYRDFMKRMNDVTKRLTQCADTRGDKTEIGKRKSLLQELISQTAYMKPKMNNVVELCDKTMEKTSNLGRETLERERSALQSDWINVASKSYDAQNDLERVLRQWEEFDSAHETLLQWLNVTDQELTNLPLKSSLEEKQEQVVGLRILKLEIEAHQRDVDGFTTLGQALQQMSADTSINKYISQANKLYKNVQGLLKECLTKWEKYAAEHESYRESYTSFTLWVKEATEIVESEKVGAEIETVTASQEEGQQKLNSATIKGERLYPDTAMAGREEIRKQLRTAKDDFEGLMVRLQAWSTSKSEVEKLENWFIEVEAKLDIDSGLKNTLAEKSDQLQTNKEVLQDVKSHSHEVDSFENMAQSLPQMSRSSKVQQFIKDIRKRYQTIVHKAKEAITNSKNWVEEHEQFEYSYEDAHAWLQLQKQKCRFDFTHGDKQSISNKLKEVQDLQNKLKPDGTPKLEMCNREADTTRRNTAEHGRKTIEEKVKSLSLEWQNYEKKLSSTRDRLLAALKEWEKYEDSYDRLSQWLKDTDRKCKDFTLVSTLEEKRAQVKKFEVQHQDILSHQNVLDSLAKSPAQPSAQPSGSDTSTARLLEDLTKRYKDLCDASQEQLQRFKKNVGDHQQYQDALQECKDHVASLRDKVKLCADITGDKSALQNKLDRAKELISQAAGMEPKLKNVVELYDKTITNTSKPGCEPLKREMSALKSDCMKVTSEAKNAQADLERALRQWKEFASAHEMLLQWFTATEQQLKNLQLKSSLEEKLEQVDRLKTLKSEIDAHQTNMDGFTDLAQSLLQTSADTSLNACISQANKRYKNLQGLLKECLTKWEKYAADHESYRKSYTSFTAWVQKAKKIVDGFSYESKDVGAEIEAVTASQEEGQQKFNSATLKGEHLCPDTAPSGCEKIRQQLLTAKDDFEGLNIRLQVWSTYKSKVEKLEKWFLEVEAKLKIDSGLKNTLKEKSDQLQTNKELFRDVKSHSHEVDSIENMAQSLPQMSRSLEFQQFIKHIRKRYQTIEHKANEAITNSENWVTEHAQYEYSYKDAHEWLQLQKQVHMCVDSTHGDKQSISKKLKEVKDLEKSLTAEGTPKLEKCIRKADAISKHTAEHGRKIIEEEVTTLRLDWQRFEKKLYSTRDRLQEALAKLKGLEKYKDSYKSLSQWLKEMEAKNFTLVSTLDEKREQLKKIQALQQDIDDHQTAFEKLDAMAEQLPVNDIETAPNPNLLKSRYEKLRTNIKEVIAKWEDYVSKHQQYQTSYRDAIKWMDGVTEQLAQHRYMGWDLEERKAQLKKEGASRIVNVQKRAEETKPQTAKAGKQQIDQELDNLQKEWEALKEKLRVGLLWLVLIRLWRLPGQSQISKFPFAASGRGLSGTGVRCVLASSFKPSMDPGRMLLFSDGQLLF